MANLGAGSRGRLSTLNAQLSTLVRRRWFLILLVGVLVVGIAAPRWVRPVTHHVDVSIHVALVLFMMAVSLDTSRLWRAIAAPGPALVAIAISFGVLPLSAWGLSQLQTGRDFQIGLMIAASVPCTLASAVVWTRRAKGDDAVALVVTMATNAISFVVTPLWLAATTGQSAELPPGAMMVQLGKVVLLPTIAGQLLRQIPWVRRQTAHWRGVIGVASQLVIMFAILIGAANVGEKVPACGFPWAGFLLAAASCLAVHLGSLGGGLGIARLLGFPRPQQSAVAFGASQKTLPVGVLLATSPEYFGEVAPLSILVMLAYHVGQLVVDTFIADSLALRDVQEHETPLDTVG